MSENIANKLIRWPDLSMYGLRMIYAKTPSGKTQLVMLGGDKHRDRVSRLGFKNKSGVWLKEDAVISANALKREFKNMIVREMPVIDTYRIMRPVSKETTEHNEDVKAKIALKTSNPIGFNHLGQEVYVSADGRFIKTVEGKLLTMSENDIRPSLFLRANDTRDIEECADALVGMIVDHGYVFRHGDMEQFASHVFDSNIEDARGMMSPLHEAINHALSRKMFKESTDAGRNSFDLAVKLHEGLPPLTQELTEEIIPLPLGVIAQRISGISDKSRIYVPHIGNGAFLSSISGNVEVLTSEEIDDFSNVVRPGLSVASTKISESSIPEHDVFMANMAYEDRSEDPVSLYKTEFNRGDHARVLAMLSGRAPEGKSVFMLKASDEPGNPDIETRKLMSYLAARYKIEGIVEVDGSLFGQGGSANNRYMVIVGNTGQSDLVNFDSVDVVYSYENLWDWADEFVSEQQRALEAPSRFENSYQAPYISASKIAAPTTMIPRNLLGPVREALAKLESEHGDIDHFVARELNFSIEELSDGRFSPEQIDAIGLAINAHKHKKGFIEADQTGIGKGRVLSAMARYAVINGLTPVFISEKANLFSDLYRDMIDIKTNDLLNPFIINPGVPIVLDRKRIRPGAKASDIKPYLESKELPPNTNMVMMTYGQLNRDNKKGQEIKSEFLKAIAPNSLLILDEAHVATGDSNIGFNVMRALRDASGVVYSSATYAKESKSFLLFNRVMPPSVAPSAIPDILSKGGDPLAEVFSAMLAEDGVMIRREHDLSKLRFEVAIDDHYAKRNEDLADKFAEILEGMGVLIGEASHIINEKNNLIRQDLHKKMLAARNGTGKVSNTKLKQQLLSEGWRIGNYGSRLFSIMRMFFLAIKTDYAADLAIAALDEGRKPVISLEMTNESLLKDVIARVKSTSIEGGDVIDGDFSVDESGEEDFDLDGMMSDIFGQSEADVAVDSQEKDEGPTDFVLDYPVTFRDALHRMLDRLCIASKYKGGEVDSVVNIENEAILSMRAAVQMKIDAFPDLHISPIDVLRQRIEDAGYTCAEISGRSVGIVNRNDGKQVVIPISMGNKNKLIDSINSGDIDATILTVAGASGISLHSSVKFQDQRQREAIELQIPNNVATRMQIFGRVNRNGQVCYPIIRSVDSGLPSETRMISMQNAKMRNMSANTTSNRDNSVLDEDMIDLLNKVGNEVARKFLSDNLHIAKRLAINESDLSEDAAKHKPDTWYADQLTQRLGMLRVAEQRDTYGNLTDAYHEEINTLNALGQNPFKANELDVNAKILESEEIYTPVIQTGSVFDRPVNMTYIEYDEEIELFSPQDLQEAIANSNKKFGDNITPVQVMRQCLTDLAAREDGIYNRAWNRNLFDSIEDAFADESSSVSSAKKRIDFIKKYATSIVPGNVVTFSDMFNNKLTGIITTINPPEINKEDLLGQYEFRVYVPGEGSQSRTLFTAIRDENFSVTTDSSEIMSMIAASGKKMVTKNKYVLEGNIFAACNWSTDNGIGVSSIYTNDQGERIRAVILPRDYPVNMKTPFSVSREIAKEVIMMAITGKFGKDSLKFSTSIAYSTSENGKGNTRSRNRIDIIYSPAHSYGSNHYAAGIKVVIPKTKQCIQFVDASEIPDVRNAQFVLERGFREKTQKIVNLNFMDIDQLIDELYDSNMGLFVDYKYREVVVEIYNRLEEEKKQAKAKQSSANFN